MLGGPGSLPPASETWPRSSLSALRLPGVSGRRTRKLGEDVPGWPRAGDRRPSELRQHSWDACAPFSSQGTCYANTRGPPHTMVPASLAAQPDLASASSPPHCPSLWRGAVSGALEGGPRPGPFLQGRKGLLGWLGMPQRMNGHANEMLMSLGQASPESSLGSCPSAARREGSSTPALPLLWADPPAPPQRLSWVERAAHWASRLGLRHSLSSVWSPSLVGPPPQGLTVHSVALGPRDCQCPSAPRCNGAVSPLSRSESRGKSLLGQD